MAPPKDDDDIELATLPTNDDKQEYDRDDDEENESDNEHDDEGSRALLGGHSPRTGPTSGPRVQLWPQIKNIVIEVRRARTSPKFISVIAERSNTTAHDSRLTFHRRIAGSSLSLESHGGG